MYPMSATRDVSKLSGWLNANAHCRVDRGGIGGGTTCGAKQAGGWSGVVGGASSREAPDYGG